MAAERDAQRGETLVFGGPVPGFRLPAYPTWRLFLLPSLQIVSPCAVGSVRVQPDQNTRLHPRGAVNVSLALRTFESTILFVGRIYICGRCVKKYKNNRVITYSFISPPVWGGYCCYDGTDPPSLQGELSKRPKTSLRGEKKNRSVNLPANLSVNEIVAWL